MQQDRTADAEFDERFCANCGEPLKPDQQAAEVYNPAEGEITSRIVHADCMRPGEEVA